MTYSYNPSKIKALGKDQMRFELGDTLVDGGMETCALSDEEYEGILENVSSGNNIRKAWLHAKLYALEAILLKLSYQADTDIDVLSYSLGARAENWQKLYEMLRRQILANTGTPAMSDSILGKPPCFYTGMNENPCAKTLVRRTFDMAE